MTLELLYESMIEREHIPDVLYHATFNALLPTIQKNGLLINPPIRNYDISDKAVYLANKPSMTTEFIDTTENKEIPEEWFNNVVILEIDTKQLDPNSLETDPNMGDLEDLVGNEEYADELIDAMSDYKYFAYTKDIPPSAITVFKHIT